MTKVHPISKMLEKTQDSVQCPEYLLLFNLYRTNVAASAMQPCTRCWPNVAATATQCMHVFTQLSPCLLETETQTISTVVPTTGLAFVRSHYVIFGGLGFDIIYVCT